MESVSIIIIALYIFKPKLTCNASARLPSIYLLNFYDFFSKKQKNILEFLFLRLVYEFFSVHIFVKVLDL